MKSKKILGLALIFVAFPAGAAFIGLMAASRWILCRLTDKDVWQPWEENMAGGTIALATVIAFVMLAVGAFFLLDK